MYGEDKDEDGDKDGGLGEALPQALSRVVGGIVFEILVRIKLAQDPLGIGIHPEDNPSLETANASSVDSRSAV